MVYTEAGFWHLYFTTLITPVLRINKHFCLTTWLAELMAQLQDLTASEQFSLASQNIVYNWRLWLNGLKFCNLLS